MYKTEILILDFSLCCMCFLPEHQQATGGLSFEKELPSVQPAQVSFRCNYFLVAGEQHGITCSRVCLQCPDSSLQPKMELPLGKLCTHKRGRAVFHLSSVSLFWLSPCVPPCWKRSGLPQLSVILKPKDQR